MDQDAFRSLLSAPRPSQGGSSSRGVLGAPAPKRGWGLKVKDGYEKKDDKAKEKPAFAPRQQQKKPVDDRYKDRAEMRRKGLDDEYKPVEKLLEDFEARKASATAPEELEAIEKQRAYLGGDAEHSVLVKGLDYALLAARKAELAREDGENMDDELEELGRELGGKKKKDKVRGEVVKEEGLGKGFKSIAQKKAEAEAAAAASGEKKKKKKKKKVKAENATEPAPPTHVPTTSAAPEITSAALSDVKSEMDMVEKPAIAAPAPVEEADDDDDIFGGVGEYNLAAAVGSDDDDDDDDDKMDVDEKPSRGRSLSRSPDRYKEGKGLGPRSPGYRHRRSGSRSRSKTRRRSYSRDRQGGRGYGPRSPGYRHGRSRSRSRSRSPDFRRRKFPSRSRSYDRRRSPSPGPYRRKFRDRSDSYSRSRSRSRSPYRRVTNHRSPSPSRDGYASRARSPRWRYSPSPPRRRYSPVDHRGRSPLRGRSITPHSLSPEPTEPPRRRSPTRSPTPFLNAPLRSPSRSPSPSSSDQGLAAPSTRLQPLASSAIPSLRSFLEADTVAAKADEKKLRKAKWRAAQGLGTQEGAEDMLGKGREVNEKQKANRDYQILMNKMNKEKGKEKEG
ncbi:hypothetical protein IAR55_007134 [Kwoniella newhampshirensis]|uniref:RED-like N-terminal domain-containing protein n=1 Tax=Kwoniella newhampshirensis TaxID=1651941 RepID=A0AAW0YTB5_9TREE